MNELYAYTPFPTNVPPCCIVAGATALSKKKHENKQKSDPPPLSDTDQKNICSYLRAQIRNRGPSSVTELVYPEGFSERTSFAQKGYYKKNNPTENSIPLTVTYSENLLDRNGVHIGQRKLLLAEVQFLVKLLTSGKREHAKFMVYVGAAPNYKMMMLSDLFPDTRFLLFDPTPFKIKDDYKNAKYTKDTKDAKSHRDGGCPKIVHVYTSPMAEYKGYTYPHTRNGARNSKKLGDMNDREQKKLFCYMTKKEQKARIFIFEHIFDARDAEVVSAGFRENKKKYCFMSDARIASKPKEEPSDGDVLLSHAQHWVWLRILLCPFTIKFRIPYILKNAAAEARKKMKNSKNGQKEIYELANEPCNNIRGIDFIKNAENKSGGYILAPVGDLYVQAYAGPSSTEGRLVGLEVKRTWEVDTTDMESRYFGFNAITRCFTRRQDPDNRRTELYQRKSTYNKPQYVSNDYALEQHIWKNYIHATRSRNLYNTQMLTDLAINATMWGDNKGPRKYIKKTATKQQIEELIAKINAKQVARRGRVNTKNTWRATSARRSRA